MTSEEVWKMTAEYERSSHVYDRTDTKRVRRKTFNNLAQSQKQHFGTILEIGRTKVRPGCMVSFKGTNKGHTLHGRLLNFVHNKELAHVELYDSVESEQEGFPQDGLAQILSVPIHHLLFDQKGIADKFDGITTLRMCGNKRNTRFTARDEDNELYDLPVPVVHHHSNIMLKMLEERRFRGIGTKPEEDQPSEIRHVVKKHAEWFYEKCLGKTVGKSKQRRQPKHPLHEINRLLHDGNVGKGIIYAIVYVGTDELPPSKISALRYVGQTWQPMIDRWIQHIHRGESFNKSKNSEKERHLYGAMKTHGFTNFVMIPIQFIYEEDG
jgi:hypothetical protein